METLHKSPGKIPLCNHSCQLFLNIDLISKLFLSQDKIAYHLQPHDSSHMPARIFHLINVPYSSPVWIIPNECHNPLTDSKYIDSTNPLSIFFFQKGWQNINALFSLDLISLRCQFIKSNKNTRVWWTAKVPLVSECPIRCSFAWIALEKNVKEMYISFFKTAIIIRLLTISSGKTKNIRG